MKKIKQYLIYLYACARRPSKSTERSNFALPREKVMAGYLGEMLEMSMHDDLAIIEISRTDSATISVRTFWSDGGITEDVVDF